jgi:hypothetical protein
MPKPVSPKYCAHFNVGDSHFHEYFDRLDAIRAALTEYHDEFGFATTYANDLANGPQIIQQDCVNVNNSCEDCNSDMNFHDYPELRYVIGPRGGVQEVAV